MTRPGGKEISSQLPLVVDDVTQSSDRIAVAAETITFNCAAAASSTGVVATDKAPIMNLVGDKVGSYWGEQKNLVYTIDDTSLIGALTETATAATVVLIDLTNNLEKMFETPAANGRYVLKAIDSGDNVLYGWIKGVAASGASYTFDCYNTPALATKSWVGTLGSFDNTAVKRIEIYSNESSFAWVTGTVLTKEAGYDEEMDIQDFLNNLVAGEYAINYRTGAVLYKKVTTGTSDTCTYNTMATASVTVSPSGASAAILARTTGAEVPAVTDDALVVYDVSESGTPPSSFRSATVDETAAQAVKASAGTLYGYNLYNPNTYSVFVKLYNTAAGSVAVGTTAVVQTIQIPAFGSVVIKQDKPIMNFSTAIAIAATKLYTDADTTAIATDVLAQVYYK